MGMDATSMGVKWARREADRSPSSTSEVKKNAAALPPYFYLIHALYCRQRKVFIADVQQLTVVKFSYRRYN
jgi:hypothetical protein